MGDFVIDARNLGKRYVIGHRSQPRSNTLREQISSGVFSAVKRMSRLFYTSELMEGDNFEDFWAIRNVDFEVREGEQVAIIGGNGAGKSTILKILSKITEPSEGTVKIKGRVASLLEVGTGFSGELTGRENIFLNGSILGMTRKEIQRKFDEIVEFAEVEQFLDTPVKRYSTGMYMRLAFAIAAHLESEILLVDEVLAVGDFKFQQKCLGKMEDIARRQSRTIIFVSHSMGIVSQLCNKAIFLDKGKVVQIGDTPSVISNYLSYGERATGYNVTGNRSSYDVYVSSVRLTGKSGTMQESFLFSESISVNIVIRFNKYVSNLKVGLMLQNSSAEHLTTIVEELQELENCPALEKAELCFKLDPSVIAPNSYAFCISLFSTVDQVYDWVDMVCPFKVVDSGTKISAYEGINLGCYFIMGHRFSCSVI